MLGTTSLFEYNLVPKNSNPGVVNAFAVSGPIEIPLNEPGVYVQDPGLSSLPKNILLVDTIFASVVITLL